MAYNKKKTIFVVCPIGAEDSTERKNSDNLEEFIINPVVANNYDVVRADRIAESGSITSQIYDQLLNADVVIADMTGHNPNVFYEIAVRHAVGKPIIHMTASGERIPFDVADQRAIYYKLDLPGAKAASTSLRAMLDTIEEGGTEPQSPITMALQRNRLANSTDPSEQRDSEIIAMLSDLRGQVSRLESSLREGHAMSYSHFVHDVAAFFQVLASSLYSQTTRKLCLVTLDNFTEVIRGATLDETARIRIDSEAFPDTMGDLLRAREILVEHIELYDANPRPELAIMEARNRKAF